MRLNKKLFSSGFSALTSHLNNVFKGLPLIKTQQWTWLKNSSTTTFRNVYSSLFINNTNSIIEIAENNRTLAPVRCISVDLKQLFGWEKTKNSMKVIEMDKEI